MDTRSRQRWTDQQVRREPSLYDEWLNEEKQQEQVLSTKAAPAKTRRHGSTAGLSATASGTFTSARNETQPEAALAAAIDKDRAYGSTLFDDRTTSRFATISTPITGTSTSAMEFSSPLTKVASSSSVRARRKELDRDNELADISSSAAQRSPSTRTLSSEQVKGRGMLGRRSSKSNNGSYQPTSSSASTTSSHVAAAGLAFDGARAPSSARPRTRTLDDRRPFVRSLGSSSSSPQQQQQQRQRMGSVHTTPEARAVDAMPTVPIVISPTPQHSTSISNRSDMINSRTGAFSAEPDTPSTSTSLPKRIHALMKTLNGRMGGNLLYRRNRAEWTEAFTHIEQEKGSLICEIGHSRKTLISDLRGCHIEFARTADNMQYIVVKPARAPQQVHLRVATPSDFDSWIAALLTWQNKTPYRDHGAQIQSVSPAVVPPIPAVPPSQPRRSSAARSISPDARKRADNDKFQSRRKSVVMSLKEAPVIKIGKMIFWDTDVTYSTTPSAMVGQPGTGRPQAYRMQSYGSRRWRRISALLRENGELKLHADHDNSLLSVVQLSQLSRCAIQRLDQSVLDNEFCIAVYPQYTSSPTESVHVLRPIFLSLESRVLHEVWFVLLRAFTIPQLYGPRLPEDFGDNTQESERDFEKMLAEQTTDMFRMERALSIRVVEAKLYPGNSADIAGSRMPHAARPEQYGYHVELLLDNETRAKTAIKFEGLNPLWGETFDFADLPPVLTSASVVIKRQPPDAMRLAQDGRNMYDTSQFTNDAHGGFGGINFDVTCGKVEIYLDELAATNEAERWWPVVNMYNQRVGEVLVKARADEGVVLMARDYQPLSDLLHKFSNGLSLQLAQIVPGELKRLSDCLLNIYQVSGRAGDWIMALVEDEIDSIHKETPITRLRFNGRANDAHDHFGSSGGHTDRELMVRDMNKNATLEANLLFRGNTLLTKSLDSHMRRVGKDFLEEALASKLREICERDPDCEVDPNRASEGEVQRNWRRLIALTSEVWKSIIAAKQKCPIELRRIFRHIRACAEDRYGDFLRSVSYSSVSGFLFLRFFCPAVLNPKLFGLFKDDIKPKGRRTLTLIAKSLQTLANMASFGTKEQWMEPMNIFLNQSRETFKNFIDDICYVPVVPSSKTASATPAALPAKIVSADTNLSYTTPMTIMQRLPPTSREGFPSLPYLIDQPRAFAELVQLWLETTSDASATREMAFPGKSKADLLAAIRQTDGDVREFHEICVKLNARTQECLSRAERAERPHSALSFQWEELIDQLQTPTDQDITGEPALPVTFTSADRVKPDLLVAEPTIKNAYVESLVGSLGRDQARTYDMPSRPAPVANNTTTREEMSSRDGRGLQSRSSDSPASPTGFDVSGSAVSSDNEQTALPSYEREILHRQREEDNYHNSKSGRDEKRGQGVKFVSALRKKRNDRDGPAANGSNGFARSP